MAVIKDKKSIINVLGTEITILIHNENDYISLTDMAKKFGSDDLIYSWMRNRNTVEFLGIWEQMNNPSFKGGEFETFRNEAGLNSFHLTPKKGLIRMKLSQSERLRKLNQIAIFQLKSLIGNINIKKLGATANEK